MSSQADVRSKFRQQIERLVSLAKTNQRADLLQEQRKWVTPERGDWDGNLFDLEALHLPFDRDENHQDFKQAVESGSTGDPAIATLQGDYLAMLERAFRERHKSAIRCRLHAAGRRLGQSHEKGVYQQGVLGYIEWLARAAKAES